MRDDRSRVVFLKCMHENKVYSNMKKRSNNGVVRRPT